MLLTTALLSFDPNIKGAFIYRLITILTLLKDTLPNPISISQLLGGEHYEQPFKYKPPRLPAEPTHPGDGLGPIDFLSAPNTPIVCNHLTVAASDWIGGRDGEMGRRTRRTIGGWWRRNRERGRTTCAWADTAEMQDATPPVFMFSVVWIIALEQVFNWISLLASLEVSEPSMSMHQSNPPLSLSVAH